MEFNGSPCCCRCSCWLGCCCCSRKHNMNNMNNIIALYWCACPGSGCSGSCCLLARRERLPNKDEPILNQCVYALKTEQIVMWSHRPPSTGTRNVNVRSNCQYISSAAVGGPHFSGRSCPPTDCRPHLFRSAASTNRYLQLLFPISHFPPSIPHKPNHLPPPSPHFQAFLSRISSISTTHSNWTSKFSTLPHFHSSFWTLLKKWRFPFGRKFISMAKVNCVLLISNLH